MNIEQIRLRLGEMAAEVERLSHERQCLAEAIGRIAVASGDTRTEFTGPDLLMVCGDAAEGIKHLTAENARPIPAQQSPRTTEATMPKGFVLWPENVTFDMVSAYESAILAPIGTFSGEGYLRMLNVVKSQFNNPLRSESSQHSQRVTVQDAREIIEDYIGYCDGKRLKPQSGVVMGMYIKKEFSTILDKLNGAKKCTITPQLTESPASRFLASKMATSSITTPERAQSLLRLANSGTCLLIIHGSFQDWQCWR